MIWGMMVFAASIGYSVLKTFGIIVGVAFGLVWILQLLGFKFPQDNGWGGGDSGGGDGGGGCD